MECNKDDAMRAKEIAKKKFLADDISGAKKFALKAQKLYPELEEISQMIATFDVHLSAEHKINGEIDWYGVLGVNPDVSEETLRKQYRKLAKVLHPDKNKSVGAEAAFKYLSQAWVLFSDKAKRAEYDQKRKEGLYQKASNSGGNSSAKPASNDFQNFTKTSGNTSKVKKKGTNRAGDPVSSHKTKHDGTFWTVCHSCKTQYEYLRVYLNHNLLCPNCHEAFLAIETAPPGSGSIRRSFSEHQWNSNHQAAGNGVYGNNDSYSQANFQWGVYHGTENPSHAGSRRDEVVRRKYTKRTGVASATGAAKRRRGMDTIGSNVGRGTGGNNLGGVNGLAANSSSIKDVCDADIQNLLMKKAKQEIWKKLKEPNKDSGAQTAPKRRRIEDEKDNLEGKKNSPANEEACSLNSGKTESYSINFVHGTSRNNKDSKILEAQPIDVPYPDFSDFDKDRTERSFGENQVWAAYDDVDGMPRFYAIISNVISLNPLELRIRWLTSKTNSEFGSSNWLGSGFAKTCGDFRVGKCEILKSLDSFSHKIKWTRGPQGEICIRPRRGDVWALYRNWSPNWNYLADGEATYKYDIVEVVEGYTEDFGVSVVPLVKVAGFKAIFHHHLDPSEIRTIPSEELSRFSHQIPSYLLTGREASNSPKGCRELDPAATPLELLRVIVHGTDEGFIEEETVTEKDLVNHIELEQGHDKRIMDANTRCIQEPEEKPKDSEASEVLVKIIDEKKDDEAIQEEEKLKDNEAIEILVDTH